MKKAKSQCVFRVILIFRSIFLYVFLFLGIFYCCCKLPHHLYWCFLSLLSRAGKESVRETNTLDLSASSQSLLLYRGENWSFFVFKLFIHLYFISLLSVRLLNPLTIERNNETSTTRIYGVNRFLSPIKSAIKKREKKFSDELSFIFVWFTKEVYKWSSMTRNWRH